MKVGLGRMIVLIISTRKLESLSKVIDYASGGRGVVIQFSFTFGIVVSNLLLMSEANH